MAALGCAVCLWGPVTFAAIVWLQIRGWSADASSCAEQYLIGWRVTLWYFLWAVIYIPLATYWGVYIVGPKMTEEMRLYMQGASGEAASPAAKKVSVAQLPVAGAKQGGC